MTIREWLTEHVDEYGDNKELAQACEKALGVSRGAVTKIIGQIGIPTGNGSDETDHGKKAFGAKTVSVDKILASHDKVGEAIKMVQSIPAGNVMKDEDVRTELGFSSDKWRKVRGSVRLNGHWTTMPDKSLVWGSKRTIEMVAEKIKEIVI